MDDDNNNGDTIRPEIMDDENQGQNVILSSSVLPDRLYILPTNNKPVFPGIVFPMMLPGGYAANVIRKVMNESSIQVLGLVLTQTEQTEETETEEIIQRDLFRVGTAARILRTQEGEDGSLQVLMQAEKRFKIAKAIEREGFLVAQVSYFDDIVDKTEEVKAMGIAIMNSMRELIKLNPLFSEEIKMFLSRNDWSDPGRLADFAVTMTSSSREELQEVLELQDVKKRMEKVLFLLRKELDINELKQKITQQIEEKISKHQREFFLREQLKAIKQELGLEKDEKTEEIDKYQEFLEETELPEEAVDRVKEEIDKLKVLSPQSPEYGVSRNYLDWLSALPWSSYSEDSLDVKRGRRILDRDHYGLEDVKDRILEFIGVAKLKGSIEGSILCLVGPPGVGKTSLGKAVAESLGREFYRFSLGGMRDEAEIKGHRRTYIGAMPGKFIQAMKTVGTSNPVIMLDEIDKVGASFRGDPASALLEVLDPEQNINFRDHFLDVPFDLSKTLFIATANVPDTIPGPLLDRMEVIRLSGYITAEKLAIGRRYLVPRMLERNGLKKNEVKFTAASLRKLIRDHAREAGVRTLEKSIGQCCRKIAAKRAAGDLDEDAEIKVTPELVDEYMGKPRFQDDPLMKRGRPGVVMGLAWTPHGGTTLYVESIALAGSTNFKLTGQLGDVMKESSYIAYSYVASRAKEFGLDPKLFEKSIHLHVPAGATPKDGPSAGITMATSLVSLAKNKRLRAHWAMTGELTLTGRVLPVGGIKEKVIAAKRSKVKNVILPKTNEKDFLEINERVRKGITAHFVESFDEVYDILFCD